MVTHPNRSKNKPRPLQHLRAASAMYPNAWKQVEVFRADRGKDLPTWPDWCFMPMAAWYSIVSYENDMDYITDLDIVADVAKLAAIGTWRYTQGIYRFDDDMRAALADTTLKGPLPVGVLLRLPEWSLYIETPSASWLGSEQYGFWAHLEWDANTGRRELRLLVDTEASLAGVVVHLGDWTVTEAVDRAVDEAARQAQAHGHSFGKSMDAVAALAASLQPMIAMLLYLCSDAPEIDDERQSGTFPANPRPKKTKKGWRLFAPDKPRVWTVGEETGAALRRERGDGQVGSPKAHLRRAHWHGYWVGPMDGDREFIYRWLSPIFVGNDKIDR